MLTPCIPSKCLESKEDKEGNHQTEETHGFWEGKSQNGVWEELRLQWWVTGVANDEGTENCSNTWKTMIVSFGREK